MEGIRKFFRVEAERKGYPVVYKGIVGRTVYEPIFFDEKQAIEYGNKIKRMLENGGRKDLKVFVVEVVEERKDFQEV